MVAEPVAAARAGLRAAAAWAELGRAAIGKSERDACRSLAGSKRGRAVGEGWEMNSAAAGVSRGSSMALAGPVNGRWQALRGASHGGSGDGAGSASERRRGAQACSSPRSFVQRHRDAAGPRGRKWTVRSLPCEGTVRQRRYELLKQRIPPRRAQQFCVSPQVARYTKQTAKNGHPVP